jgi:hypothetical protein
MRDISNIPLILGSGRYNKANGKETGVYISYFP